MPLTHLLTPLKTPLLYPILTLCALLLFLRLNAYPLWDDEACTALLARGVWATGDTTAELNSNVMAYSYGQMISGSPAHDRFQPPLQCYLMAPFVGPLPDALRTQAWPARLPMALTGLAAIALLLHFLRPRLTLRQWWIFTALLLTNVALFLYLRQARYYAPLILLSTAAALLYYRWPTKPTWRHALPVGLLLALLPATSLQAFATTAPAFLLDYLLFSRRRSPLTPTGYLALLTPIALGLLPILLIWNPLFITHQSSYTGHWWYRPMMVWWQFRDANQAQLATGSLVLAALLLGIARPSRYSLLLRGALAIAVVCTMEGLINPQGPDETPFAEVRHLAQIIPLGLLLATAVLDAAFSFNRWFGAALLALASLTNILHWGALYPERLRSVPLLWARELLNPLPDPYTAALNLLRQNTLPGDTVGVEPAFMRYPLMYHLPDRLYTWQIKPQYQPRLPNLDPRQFEGAEPPQYLLDFGNWAKPVREQIESQSTKRYLPLAHSNVYWQDLYRPEINMRAFTLDQINVLRTTPAKDAIVLFKLQNP